MVQRELEVRNGGGYANAWYVYMNSQRTNKIFLRHMCKKEIGNEQISKEGTRKSLQIMFGDS